MKERTETGRIAAGTDSWLRAADASGAIRSRNSSPAYRIYAYQKGKGYVGLGEVVAGAVPAKEFIAGETGTPILDADLAQPNLSRDRDDPDTCEWLVGVRWIRAVPVTAAYTRRGIFANQNIVCRLRDPATLDFLAEKLGSAPD